MSIPLNDCPHDTILLRTAPAVYLASRYAKYYRARENTWYLCVSYVREKLTNQINTGCCTRIVQKCTWDQPRVAVDSQSRGRSEAGSSRQAQGAVKTTRYISSSAFSRYSTNSTLQGVRVHILIQHSGLYLRVPTHGCCTCS